MLGRFFAFFVSSGGLRFPCQVAQSLTQRGRASMAIPCLYCFDLGIIQQQSAARGPALHCLFFFLLRLFWVCVLCNECESVSHARWAPKFENHMPPASASQPIAKYTPFAMSEWHACVFSSRRFCNVGCISSSWAPDVLGQRQGCMTAATTITVGCIDWFSDRSQNQSQK